MVELIRVSCMQELADLQQLVGRLVNQYSSWLGLFARLAINPNHELW